MPWVCASTYPRTSWNGVMPAKVRPVTLSATRARPRSRVVQPAAEGVLAVASVSRVRRWRSAAVGGREA